MTRLALGAMPNEVPALVDHLDARPVELRLHAEAGDLGVREAVADAPVKLGELLLGKLGDGRWIVPARRAEPLHAAALLVDQDRHREA